MTPPGTIRVIATKVSDPRPRCRYSLREVSDLYREFPVDAMEIDDTPGDVSEGRHGSRGPSWNFAEGRSRGR